MARDRRSLGAGQAPGRNPLRGVACATVLLLGAATILCAGLGRVGLWQAGELPAVRRAMASAGRPAFAPPAQAAMVRVGVRALGPTDVGARLPTAVLALGAAAALALAVRAAAGSPAGVLTGVVYVTLPLVFMNARQVLGGGVAQSASTLLLAAVAYALRDRPGSYGPGRLRGLVRGLAPWLAVVAAGGLGVLAAGWLLGVAPVALGVAAAVALRWRAEGAGNRAAGIALGVTGAVTAALGVRAMLAPGGGYSALVGAVVPAVAPAGAAASRGFDALIEQVGHATFPWTGLVAFGVVQLATLPAVDGAAGARESSGAAARVRLVAFGTLVAAFGLQSLHARSVGPSAFIAPAPLAVAVGLSLADAARRGRALGMVALGAALVTLIVLRDLVLFPHVACAALGLPVEATPLAAAPSAAPYAALEAVLFTLGVLVPCYLGRWLSVAVLAATPMTAALVATQVYLPALTRHLSPRDPWAHVRHARRAADPVARYGSPDDGADEFYGHLRAPSLSTEASAVAWLRAPSPPRRYLLVSGDALAALNRAYRLTEPVDRRANLPLLDGANPSLYVAVSDLGADPSDNPLDAVVSAVEPGGPGDPAGQRWRPHGRVAVDGRFVPEPARFDDAVEFLGYTLDGPTATPLVRGGTLALTYHFRVLRAVPTDPQVFVHLDGPCARVNGDHAPAGGRYPASLWLPGDVIHDAHRLALPRFCRAGTYTLYLGLFHGDTRMRVAGGAHDEDNRVVVARFAVP